MLRTRTVNMFVYIENPREHRANLLDLIKKKIQKVARCKINVWKWIAFQ